MSFTPRSVADLTPDEQARAAAIARGQEKLTRAKKAAYAEGEEHGLRSAASLMQANAQVLERAHAEDLGRMEKVLRTEARHRVQGARAVGGVVGLVVGMAVSAGLFWGIQESTLGTAFDHASDATARGVALGAVQNLGDEK